MSPSRHTSIDLLKVLAAQAIVLHHLAIYGPIADALHAWLPDLMGLLSHYGRMAVQVFLVVGGYLSAQALSQRGGTSPSTGTDRTGLDGRWARAQAFWAPRWAAVQQRYVRLAWPFMAAMACTVAAEALVEQALPELAATSVSLGQVLAHAALLHGVLGEASLSVGAWYVAIDMQLFLLLLVLLSLPRARWLAVAVLTAGALFGFNLNAELDNWGVYFFGAYGLGALVHGAQGQARARWWLAAVLALGVAALAFAWRERLVVALATACVLAWAPTWRWGEGLRSVLAALSQQSYALFLIHYSVLLLVNALYDQHAPDAHGVPLAFFLLAWALSNVAALPFYRWVEQPAGRWRRRAQVLAQPQPQPIGVHNSTRQPSGQRT